MSWADPCSYCGDHRADCECGHWGEQRPKSNPVFTEKYRHCNHHHELTDDHQVVDFGDGEFVANKKAIPLLQALAELGLRTRTHHVDDESAFVSILVEPGVNFEIRMVHEKDADRTKYNGMTELIISWDPKP